VFLANHPHSLFCKFRRPHTRRFAPSPDGRFCEKSQSFFGNARQSAILTTLKFLKKTSDVSFFDAIPMGISRGDQIFALFSQFEHPLSAAFKRENGRTFLRNSVHIGVDREFF
jgi:hypothetical protein